MLPVLLIVIGIAAVLYGSDLAIAAAIRLARRSGVPPLLIGLTLTSIGTSLPEIATNVAAGLSSRAGEDASGLLVGNIIGSCLSQITLLLGLVGLTAAMKKPDNFLRDGAMMLLAAVGMLGACADGVVEPTEGMVLMAIYTGYLLLILRGTPRNTPDTADLGGSLPRDVLVVLVGLALVIFGADTVIDQAITLARSLGTPEVVIGLILGLGTGIPELTVALQAARKGSADLGLGNLIGSNITDPMLSFSAGVLIHEVTVPREVLTFDFPFWLLSSVIALWFIWTRDQLSRLEASFLVAMFFGYLAARALLIS